MDELNENDDFNFVNRKFKRRSTFNSDTHKNIFKISEVNINIIDNYDDNDESDEYKNLKYNDNIQNQNYRNFNSSHKKNMSFNNIKSKNLLSDKVYTSFTIPILKVDYVKQILENNKDNPQFIKKKEKNMNKITKMQKVRAIENDYDSMLRASNLMNLENENTGGKFLRETHESYVYKPFFPQKKQNLLIKSFKSEQGKSKLNYRSKSMVDIEEKLQNKNIDQNNKNLFLTSNTSNKLNSGRTNNNISTALNSFRNSFSANKNLNSAKSKHSVITQNSHILQISHKNNISTKSPKNSNTNLIKNVSKIYNQALKQNVKIKPFEQKMILNCPEESLPQNNKSNNQKVTNNINIKQLNKKYKLDKVDHNKLIDETDLQNYHVGVLKKCYNPKVKKLFAEVFRKVELEDRLFNTRSIQESITENKLEFLRMKKKLKNISKETFFKEKKLEEENAMKSYRMNKEIEDLQKVNLNKNNSIDNMEWDIQKMKILKHIKPMIYEKIKLNKQIRRKD